MSVVTQDSVFASVMRGLVWRAEHQWDQGTAQALLFGFVVPETKMVALSRDYFAYSTAINVELFEATFTGGVLVNTINRDLSRRNEAPPVQFYQGVIPDSLTDRITGFYIQAPSGVRVGVRGDLQPFVHEPFKSYVLSIANDGNGVQPFSFALDFRMMFPGEDE